MKSKNKIVKSNGGCMDPRPLSREIDMQQSARDWHDHNVTDLESINRTLFATIQVMEQTKIPYAIIGGIAVKELGRPRITHDIDIFVRPDDASTVLDILDGQGFITEKRDPFWLFKAWREEVLVDIIFKSSGDIYFDEEVRSHVRRIPYQGYFVNAISPEDFIVIKAAAHQEHNPHHWHDALAVLTQGNIDWDYLLKRAKHAPRRVLSLLIYAQSNDVAIPTEIIQKLYRTIFEPPSYVPEPIHHPYRHEVMKQLGSAEKPECAIYTKGKIMEALTSDERIAEHDVKVYVDEKNVVARGEVFSEDQKKAVEEVIRKHSPKNLDLKNQITVRVLTPSEGSEVIK